MVKVRLKKQFVEEYLARKNKSQNWLALRLGISSGYMSQLINGTRRPGPILRSKILDVLDHQNYDDIFSI